MSTHQAEFPTIEELSNGFSEYKLEQSTCFVGQTMTLNYEDASQITLAFISDTVLTMTEGEVVTPATYTLVSPRESIYFLDFVKSYGDVCSISIVLDFTKHIATTLFGLLPTKEEVEISQFERAKAKMEMTSVKGLFKHAAIDAPFTEATAKHEATSDLVGKRLQFRYSQNDVYEHIYLNENFYVWHCIAGIEKGLCDTDRCYYYKIADNLYWFTWLEKVVPTIGTVVEDLNGDVMRSYGKLYGYETYDMTRVTNFPVGSYATLLNQTTYAK